MHELTAQSAPGILYFCLPTVGPLTRRSGQQCSSHWTQQEANVDIVTNMLDKFGVDMVKYAENEAKWERGEEL
jgi:hypothetical protein